MSRTVLAVLGCGTMGQGIARAGAAHGMDIALHDSDPQRAVTLAESLPGWLARRGHGARGGSPEVSTHPTITSAVSAADVVLEAVTELLDVKTEVLRAVRAHARPEALLATNTSTISIAALGERAGCVERLIGMHFFNPAEKLRLVEIVHAPDTPEEVVRRAEHVARALGKTPIVIRDQPGFVTSRLGLLLGNEAMTMLAEGSASAEAIDTAMRLGYNHPMGPLELADLVGLDARLNNLRSLHRASGDERFRPPEILVRLVAGNHLGRKTARGFYFYDAQGRRGDAAPVPGGLGRAGPGRGAGRPASATTGD